MFKLRNDSLPLTHKYTQLLYFKTLYFNMFMYNAFG